MSGSAAPVSSPLDGWLDKLARPEGDPGGGYAVGLMLGVATSLLSMVAGYTAHESADGCRERLGEMREAALLAGERDGEVSAALGAALRADPSPEREAAVRDAAFAATSSSARIGELCLAVFPELERLEVIGNRSVAADLVVGAEALCAALGGSTANIRFNLALLARHCGDADGLNPRIEGFAATANRIEAARSRVDALRRRVSLDG